MKHTLNSGSGIRPLIFTSKGPKEMSQQIGKVPFDCKTAERCQSLGFSTYPHAFQLHISLLNIRGFRIMNKQVFCIMHATPTQGFLHGPYVHFRDWLLVIIKNIYFSSDQISCCPEALNLGNGLMLLGLFEFKQALQRLFWT